MKRITFQANEWVDLLMPWSEAMLSCRRADRVIRLRVVEDQGGKRCSPTVEYQWPDGFVDSFGYTLTECGIREEEEGYSGWERTAGDPPYTEAEVQQEAARITGLLQEALTPGAPTRAPWKQFQGGDRG